MLNSTADSSIVTPKFITLYNGNPSLLKASMTIARSGVGGVLVAYDGSGTGQMDGFGRRCFIDGVTGQISCKGGYRDGSAVQVVGIRRTEWQTWSGVAARSSVATSVATLQDVAEALKALIDDLHNERDTG